MLKTGIRQHLRRLRNLTNGRDLPIVMQMET